MRAAVARVTWLAGWPVRMLLLAGIWLYRSTLGPTLAARCRFHPSCSAYASGAIQVHGALKGTALATWRLLRCSPLTAGGPDPVPPRRHWRAEAPSGIVR